MIDIAHEIDAVQRGVGSVPTEAGEGRIVRLTRTYDAGIGDVWDALTTPERISRWFLPVSGDLRLGGRYQFEGQAGGSIVACERPNRLQVTWVVPADRRRCRGVRSRDQAHAVRRRSDDARACPYRRRPRRVLGRVRPGRRRRGLGDGRAGPRAVPPDRLHGRRHRGVAAVGRGPGVLGAEQRGLGCGEPRRGRRSRRSSSATSRPPPPSTPASRPRGLKARDPVPCDV